MISGPPPGRISRLFTAWADWLFEKLSPPEPTRSQRTQPPKLVKSGRVEREVTGSPANDSTPLSLRSEAR
jgi:hypothetical protein